jgi:hypothetical protein
MMMDQTHHFLWIIMIGDLSHVHHVLTSFLDLLNITEDGLHVLADDARDVLYPCHVIRSDSHTDRSTCSLS